MKETKVFQSFGRGVRQARLAKGWSQEVLGEKIGLTFNTVSNIERGKFPTDLKTIARIAMCLDVTVGELFGGLPTDSPPAHRVATTKLLDLLKDQNAEVVEDICSLVRSMLDVKRKTSAHPNVAKRKPKVSARG